MKALVLGSQPIVFILLGCGRKTNMATFPEKRKAIVFRNIDYWRVKARRKGREWSFLPYFAISRCGLITNLYWQDISEEYRSNMATREDETSRARGSHVVINGCIFVSWWYREYALNKRWMLGISTKQSTFKSDISNWNTGWKQ